MSVPDGSLYPKVPAGSPDPVVLQMPSVGQPDLPESGNLESEMDKMEYPVGVPDGRGEPEMQAQPGIFTNERGNLKVRVRPRRAPVHVQSRTERGSVTPEPLAEARPPPPRALGCPEP